MPAQPPAFGAASQCNGNSHTSYLYSVTLSTVPWTASEGTVLTALQAVGGGYAIGSPDNGGTAVFTANFPAAAYPPMGGVCPGTLKVEVGYRLASAAGAGTIYTLEVVASETTFSNTDAPTTWTTVGGNLTTLPNTVTVRARRNGGTRREFWVDYVRVVYDYW